MTRFDGYLFSKLHLIGSKSEGPSYFLQQWNYSEVPVIKDAMPWEEDPLLHKLLGKKVTIEGSFYQDGIHYQNVTNLQPPEKGALEALREPKLEIILEVPEVIWVNKMPHQDSPKMQTVELSLLVKWPYRSIWRGWCPTTQIYDFFVEQEGKVVWQWSKGKMFGMAFTPVTIPGSDEFTKYSADWNFSTGEIKEEGTYTIRAVFIASGQEVTKEIEVKFAH